MTEQSIFEHLLRDDDYDLDQINPLLIPEATAKICSAIAHDSDLIGKNFYLPNHHWNDNLMLLYNLSMKDEAHYHADNTNISTILDLLGTTLENKDDKLHFVDDWVREAAMGMEKLKADVRKRHNEIEKRKEKNHEFWCKKVKEMEVSTGIEWTPPTQKKISKADPFIIINPFESPGQIEQKVKSCQRDDKYRLKHIQFGYAVINLRRKCQVSSHLRILLKSLSVYKEMYNFEKRFCKYLFKYIEIPLIDTCTILITGTEEDFRTHLTEYVKTEDFKCLIAACKLNNSIQFKVTNVLYTLYFYSRLNIRIIHFLNKIKTAVEAS